MTEDVGCVGVGDGDGGEHDNEGGGSCTYHAVERFHPTICNHIACNVIPSVCAACEMCVCSVYVVYVS